jgi:hypothetical protein
MNPIFDRLRSRTAALTHDLLTVPVAWLGAFWLRFNLETIPPEFLEGALYALPWVVLIQGVVYWLFGLYRGVWRFASLPDLVRIGNAAFAGTVLVVVALFVVNRSLLLPRSVPVLFLGLQILLLAGPRLLYRLLKDHRLSLRAGQRVLIVGADRAGEMLARDMLRDPQRAYCPGGLRGRQAASPRRRGPWGAGPGRDGGHPPAGDRACDRADPARHTQRRCARDAAPGGAVRAIRGPVPDRTPTRQPSWPGR